MFDKYYTRYNQTVGNLLSLLKSLIIFYCLPLICFKSYRCRKRTCIIHVNCIHVLFFQFFPRWLAPNVLTFSGWSLLFMIYAVTCYYDPHFTAAGDPDESKRLPALWWLIFAVAHFAAHTFDGCDGKQARRTNSR